MLGVLPWCLLCLWEEVELGVRCGVSQRLRPQVRLERECSQLCQGTPQWVSSLPYLTVWHSIDFAAVRMVHEGGSSSRALGRQRAHCKLSAQTAGAACQTRNAALHMRLVLKLEANACTLGAKCLGKLGLCTGRVSNTFQTPWPQMKCRRPSWKA